MGDINKKTPSVFSPEGPSNLAIELSAPSGSAVSETKTDKVTLSVTARWYVIQTKPLAETAVQKHFENAGIESFLPKIRQMIRGKKRGASRIKSLFPSYVFAHANLRDPNLHRMVRFTRGVRRILGDGKDPVPVPDEMIDIIRERVGEDGVIEQGLVMKKGDCVRVRGGVFKDLIGILDKPVSSAGRVRVLLQVMHHQVRCELSAADIEKMDV